MQRHVETPLGICYHTNMRSLQRPIWLLLLAVVAFRPWVLDLVYPERIILVQWAGLGIGLVWWVIQQGWRRPLHAPLLVPCLILFLAYLLSATLSDHRLEAFIEGQSLAFGVVLCAAVALASERHRRQLLVVLVITGTVLALRALWQAAVLFPAFERFAWSDLTRQTHVANFVTEVIGRRRVFGPFPLPALLAGALVILLPVSVAVLQPWARTSKRRLVAIAIWGIQGTALFLTQSLGGLASICAATLLVLMLRHHAWRQRIVMFGITLVSIGVLLVLRPELTMPDHALNPIVQRWRYWNSTVEMIRDHPIRGIGAGDYASVYSNYQRPWSTQTHFAHNVWLQTWAVWGLLGLIGLLGLFVGSIRLAVSQPTGVQIALWGFWMIATIDITWSVMQVACLWWPLLGLLTPPRE